MSKRLAGFGRGGIVLLGALGLLTSSSPSTDDSWTQQATSYERPLFSDTLCLRGRPALLQARYSKGWNRFKVGLQVLLMI